MNGENNWNNQYNANNNGLNMSGQYNTNSDTFNANDQYGVNNTMGFDPINNDTNNFNMNGSNNDINANDEEPKKKKKIGVYLVIIIVFILAVAFLVYHTVTSNKKMDNNVNDNENDNGNEVTEQPPEDKPEEGDTSGSTTGDEKEPESTVPKKLYVSFRSFEEVKKLPNYVQLCGKGKIVCSNYDLSGSSYHLLNENYSYKLSKKGVVFYDNATGKTVTVDESKEYHVLGDSTRLTTSDAITSRNSNKYVVVAGNKKGTGLIDYKGKKIIDIKYDDLMLINNDEMIALKDGKYGVINAKEEKIIDFKYEEMQKLNENYLVVQKDHKLGIIDTKGNVIVPFNEKIADIGSFALRLCCSNENNFSIINGEDEIIISYKDASKIDDHMRYGYGDSYLIIDSDGNYRYEDEIYQKYYNYSKNYVYVLIQGSKINIYNQSKKLVASKDFGKENMVSVEGYLDTENLVIRTIDDNLDDMRYYYNNNTQEIVTDKELDKKVKEAADEENDKIYALTSESGELTVNAEGKDKKIYSPNKKLILTINKTDDIEYLYDNYYVVTNKDKEKTYYYINYPAYNMYS